MTKILILLILHSGNTLIRKNQIFTLQKIRIVLLCQESIKYELMNIQEPLQFLVEKYSFYADNIDRLVFGAKYCAVILQNGDIGVASTLGQSIEITKKSLQNPDLNNPNHRIFINAYFNAKFNLPDKDYIHGDIMEHFDFNKYKDVVMIGYFKPVIEKLDRKDVKISIFDYLHDQERIISQSFQKEYLNRADAIILSATSIFNNSFLSIVNHSKNNADILLLGPSTPLCEELFEYKNVKALLGTVFQKKDERVLQLIRAGEGTRHFQKFGKKVISMI